MTEICQEDSQNGNETTLYVQQPIQEQETIVVQNSPVLFSDADDSPLKFFTGPDVIPETLTKDTARNEKAQKRKHHNVHPIVEMSSSSTSKKRQ